MKSAIALVVALAPTCAWAQGTIADYQRAQSVREKFQGLALNVPGAATWIGDTTRFWYRKSVPGGDQFVVVDAASQTKRPAFDHEKLAASLAAAAGQKVTALKLPFQAITFTGGEEAVEFNASGASWRCALSDYSCAKRAPAPQTGGGGARPPADEFENDVADGISYLSPQQESGRFGPFTGPPAAPTRASPDGAWEAFIRNYNVYLQAKGSPDATPLSSDGSEGNFYSLASLAWSPDSKRLVAYRIRPGYKREVHFIESSPADQLQPKHFTREYAKPGDLLDDPRPVLFDIASKRQTEVDNALFANPYSLTRPLWREDSRAFTFEYNQRGHQVYRVIEADAVTAKARVVISEESPTFFAYRPLVPNPRDTGKKYRFDVDSSNQEIIWMSERDGWAHLYLYDGVTGKPKHQITKGKWVVRSVEKVDTEKRQIWFHASGMYPGQDPYFVHYYRINFDGSGLTALTQDDGDHTVRFSSDMKYYVDTWSRVDTAPVSQLRATVDGRVLIQLERGDLKPLLAAGWRPPEVFTAKGRDGVTEIWGLIYRPTNFDTSRKYPVVETIYNGPQGSFVPKSFSLAVQPLAELGFIVAQIDGMGTNNRSKAFHDVAWKNLGDAGLPDRILWHQAVAEKYRWYDITRVGIYGNSAGGQNALGALLFHPEFYKVAVSSSGCHDNRMDKIWWNELWMGWPLGPHYAAASNVDNAHRLQGKLLLIVGELDTNVDPSSTYQVVNALIKANKKFDLLTVPSGGHGAGGPFGQRMLQDFFVHHLLGVEPPDWNQLNHVP